MKLLKTIVLAAALLTMGAVSANAQFIVGPKAGLSVSWIPGTVIYGYEDVVPHNSFYAGAFAAYELSDRFFLQTELLYAVKGHSDKSESDGNYSRSIGYVQLPVFAGLSASGGRLAVMAGPEFGYMVYSRSKLGKLSEDTRKECNKFNFALGLQLGYLLTDNLGVDVKFDWGVTQTFVQKIDRGRNLSAQIGLSYRFEL